MSTAEKLKSIFQVALAAFLCFVVTLQSTRLWAEEQSPMAFRDGPYVGMSAGRYGLRVWGKTLKADGTVGVNASEESANISSYSSLLNLTVGHEFARDEAVIVGFEASVSDFDGDHINYSIRANSSISSSVEYEQGPIFSLRRKVGLVSGRTMLFGTLGPALLWEKQTRTQYVQDGGNTAASVVSFSETDKKIRFGAALSLGVRRAIATDWSMSFELHHVLLVPQTFHFPNARGGVVTAGGYGDVQGRNAESAFRNTAFMIGLTRKF